MVVPSHHEKLPLSRSRSVIRKYTSVTPVQLLKACDWISLTVDGMTTVVSAVQKLKASSLIVTSPSGKMAVLRFVHRLNAFSPM